MENIGATTSAKKLVEEVMSKMVKKTWNKTFLARIMTTIERKGGIEKIQKVVETNNNLMGFTKEELVFSDIVEGIDEIGMISYNSIMLVFTLPNEHKFFSHQPILKLEEMEKNTFTRCKVFEKELNIENESTKLVEEIMNKIELVENKRFDFIARIMTSLSCEGGISKIKEKLIERERKTELMGFEEKELIFYSIKDDDGDPKYMRLVFRLPNGREYYHFLYLLLVKDMKKEIFLKYRNYFKDISQYFKKNGWNKSG